jgi:hypothetical protein
MLTGNSKIQTVIVVFLIKKTLTEPNWTIELESYIIASKRKARELLHLCPKNKYYVS